MVLRRIAEDAAFATARNDSNKVTFQTLRHTFASRLVMRGVDLSMVANLMGHSSIDKVVRVYDRLSPTTNRRAMPQPGHGSARDF